MLRTNIKNTKKAFTLAEVLITLGIIGVVAAMTIPVLLNSVEERDLKAKWKKEFSTISQAFMSIKDDHGGNISEYLDGSTTSVLGLASDFAEKLKLSSSCFLTSNGGTLCEDSSTNLGTIYKSLDGVAIPEYDFRQGQLLLLDGARIYFRTYDANYSLIFVDVNGPFKKPNVLGKDLFIALVSRDKIEPAGTVSSGLAGSCNSAAVSCPTAKGFHNGSYCAGAGCSAKYLYSE